MKREKMAYRLKKELDAARYAHTLGVEKTAREMAEKFGVDEEKAALAGLLHDCAKCMPLSQMTKAAKNEKLDPVMKESKALMHAVAGAHVAQDVYDVHDPEVLGAIRWHTTGHANMTKLEKIVYLADMIEPNRKPYPGLEALRKLCMTDLDEAMNMALLMNMFIQVGLIVLDVLALISVGAGTLSFLILVRYLVTAAVSFGAALLGVKLMRLLAANNGYALLAVYCWGVALFTFILNLMA